MRRGHILLSGRDITRMKASERVRAGLCHVPDPRGIFPSLTVRDNLVLQAPTGTVERPRSNAPSGCSPGSASGSASWPAR